MSALFTPILGSYVLKRNVSSWIRPLVLIVPGNLSVSFLTSILNGHLSLYWTRFVEGLIDMPFNASISKAFPTLFLTSCRVLLLTLWNFVLFVPELWFILIYNHCLSWWLLLSSSKMKDILCSFLGPLIVPLKCLCGIVLQSTNINYTLCGEVKTSSPALTFPLSSNATISNTW